MTYLEITTAIKAYNNKQKYEMQKKASMDYVLADLIGSSLSRLFSKDAKYPQIHDVYPHLFKEEKQKQEKQPQQQQHWQIMKERINAYASQKRKRGEKN